MGRPVRTLGFASFHAISPWWVSNDTPWHNCTDCVRWGLFDAYQTPEGSDLLEEGILQASRAISEERQKQLARLICRSLSQNDIKYEISRKLLNLFNELTDPEVLWLIYYSLSTIPNYEFQKKLIQENPEVLKPISKEIGQSQEIIDKASIQDSYKNTLDRLGLIEDLEVYQQITPLGKLLVRYIDTQFEHRKVS